MILPPAERTHMKKAAEEMLAKEPDPDFEQVDNVIFLESEK